MSSLVYVKAVVAIYNPILLRMHQKSTPLFISSLLIDGLLYPVISQPVRKLPHRPLTLSADLSETISKRLDQLMLEIRPFLRPQCSIKDLAGDIDVPSYILSFYLNQHKGMRFTDYINKYRVDHFACIVKQGALTQFTMSAIAAVCGFNNRNSLCTAIKRFTGMTPSEYVKMLTGEEPVVIKNSLVTSPT